MEMIRVIIVDEQPLFRQGIRSTLEQMGDCAIIGDSTNADEIFELARTGNPDVAIIDASLNFIDSLEITRPNRHLFPRMTIIILTPSEDEDRLFQFIKLGSSAYYTHTIIITEFTET